MNAFDRAVEQKRLMKLVCKVYETPGALEQMEGEIRTKDEKKGIFRKKSEGPLDSKEIKKILDNPTLVSIVTTLCAENAMYTETLNALNIVTKSSDKKEELAAQAKSVQKEKEKKIHKLREIEGIATTVDEFATVIPMFAKKSMETAMAVAKITSNAIRSSNLSDVGRKGMEPVYDAPRISILEQMRGDEKTVTDAVTMYKALASGEVDKIVVNGKKSFSDMAKMFTDEETKSAFITVGTMNKEVGSKNNIDKYRNDAEQTAVEAVEPDISEGPITYGDYTSIVPDDLTDQEFLKGIQGFGEKIALTSVTNRAKANVELKRIIASAEEEHLMNVKTGKVTRVSTYGDSMKTVLDKVTAGKDNWSFRLNAITLGEERVKKDIQTKAEIIARFGDLPKVTADFEEVRAVYGTDAGREEARKLMESRQGMSVGQVMQGKMVAKTTSKVTSELSKENEGKITEKESSKDSSKIADTKNANEGR